MSGFYGNGDKRLGVIATGNLMRTARVQLYRSGAFLWLAAGHSSHLVTEQFWSHISFSVTGLLPFPGHQPPTYQRRDFYPFYL